MMRDRSPTGVEDQAAVANGVERRACRATPCDARTAGRGRLPVAAAELVREYDALPQPGFQRLAQTYYANILLELK
jgi:hypothetical protein